MKMRGYRLAMMVGAVMVGVVGCGQEEPKTEIQSKPAAESTGQAIVDSIKAPLDKAQQVEGTLEKAAGKTADTVKDTAQ